VVDEVDSASVDVDAHRSSVDVDPSSARCGA